MNRSNAPSVSPAAVTRPGDPIRRAAALVVSHERSGTHFLINALTRAYGFPVGHVDFDWQALNINFFHPRQVANVLAKIGDQRDAPLVKSHHAVEFFSEVLDEVLKHQVIFYIHRDPVDVMISYWRVILRWPWHEGPRCATAEEFAAAVPEGHMLRYQMKQRRHILDRWAQHVDGWTAAAIGRTRIVLVRYDQLRDNYAATVSAFGGVLGLSAGDLTPPDRNKNVITGLPAERLERPNRAALLALAAAEVGDTMRRLGYA